jgi:hypothetical protein
MTPKEALEFLYWASSHAPMPRSGHLKAEQALLVLAEALGGLDMPAVELKEDPS